MVTNGLVRTIGFSPSELTERRESQTGNRQSQNGNDFTLRPNVILFDRQVRQSHTDSVTKE